MKRKIGSPVISHKSVESSNVNNELVIRTVYNVQITVGKSKRWAFCVQQAIKKNRNLIESEAKELFDKMKHEDD